MAKNKRIIVPATSVRGKKLKESEDSVKTSSSTKSVQPIQFGLTHNTHGTVKKGEETKPKAVQSASKEKLYRQSNVTLISETPSTEKITSESNITVVMKEKNSNNNYKGDNDTEVIPKIVSGKPIDTNTISDLSMPQSQQPTEQGNLSTFSVTPYVFYNTAWPSVQDQALLNKDATESMIEQYVKGELFHKLKFISSPEMMMYSQNPRSLCHLFCTKFNVQGTNQGIFWSTYSKVIIKALNKKRSDVTNAMKQAFKGNIFELLFLYNH